MLSQGLLRLIQVLLRVLLVGHYRFLLATCPRLGMASNSSTTILVLVRLWEEALGRPLLLQALLLLQASTISTVEHHQHQHQQLKLQGRRC